MKGLLRHAGALIGINLIFIFYAKSQDMTWGGINSNLQDLPISVSRMPDSHIIMAGVRFGNYYSKHNLLMVELNESGTPLLKKEISLKDTSIANTGGVFQFSDSEYVVFATFDIDTPYKTQCCWGYLILDKEFNVKKVKFKEALTSRAGIEFSTYNMRMKQDEHKQNYYGVLQLYDNDIATGNNSYNAQIILENNLEEAFYNIDSLRRFITPDLKDTLYIPFKHEQFGDMVQMNDTIFIYMDAPSGMTGSYSFIYNKASGKSLGGEQWLTLTLDLDSVNGIDKYIDHPISFLQLTKWTDTTLLISAPVKYEVFPKTGGDTNLIINNIAQSAILEVMPNSNGFKYKLALKYTLVEPYWWQDTTSIYYLPSTYYSAQQKNLDFTDKDKIYYARVASDAGFFGYNSHSVIMVTQFNSQLKKQWTTEFQSETPSESPYNIVATKDGGCLLFTRKLHRLYNDPDFTPPDKFPEYDIAVYKINQLGIVTEVHEVNSFLKGDNKLIVYPNPSNGELFVDQADQNALFEITDISGRSLLKGFLNNNYVNISQLNSGIYIIKIKTTDCWRITKIIRN